MNGRPPLTCLHAYISPLLRIVYMPHYCTFKNKSFPRLVGVNLGSQPGVFGKLLGLSPSILIVIVSPDPSSLVYMTDLPFIFVSVAVLTSSFEELIGVCPWALISDMVVICVRRGSNVKLRVSWLYIEDTSGSMEVWRGTESGWEKLLLEEETMVAGLCKD